MQKDNMLIDKDKRISQEVTRLKKIYNTLDKSLLSIALPILENAAYVKILLDELKIKINQKGHSQRYKNGDNQYGVKLSADVIAFDKLLITYNKLVRQLVSMLPKETKDAKNEKAKEFDKFLQR